MHSPQIASFEHLTLEALESRIAPAIFAMGPDGVIINVRSGETVTSLDPINASVGADFALLLRKGDSLYFDADGTFNRRSDDLMFLNRGDGAVLFMDDPGTGRMTIEGVAVTDKFRGKAGAAIHGDIATVLNMEGRGKRASFSLNIDETSDPVGSVSLVPGRGILSFKSTDLVSGSIIAGGNISKINLPGVGGIWAGTTSSLSGDTFAEIDFGGDSPIPLDAFYLEPGKKGSSIRNVKMTDAGGLDIVLVSGSPSDSGPKQAGQPGGDISKVTIDGAVNNVLLTTGKGGHGNGYLKPGGHAGKVSRLTISSLTGELDIQTGDGGYGTVDYGAHPTRHAPGGNGGNAEKLSIFSASEDASVSITLGNAGGGGGQSRSGGSLIKSSFTGDLFSSFALETGDGYIASDFQDGASGGDVFRSTLRADVAGDVVISTGPGGISEPSFRQGNVGGDAGEIDLHEFFQGVTMGGLSLYLGDGGVEPDRAQYQSLQGVGGKVQNIEDLELSFYDGANVTIETGSGGPGSRVATDGGSISNLTLKMASQTGSFGTISILTGSGGNAESDERSRYGKFPYFFTLNHRSSSSDIGGDGGSIDGLTVEASATGSLVIETGNGGSASEAKSYLVRYDIGYYEYEIVSGMSAQDAGNGGSVRNVSISGTVGDLAIQTGNGNNSWPAPGIGDVDWDLPDESPLSQRVLSGVGGKGGSISLVSAAVTGDSLLVAGNSGEASTLPNSKGATPAGGGGASISGISLMGMGANASVSIQSGNAGSGGAPANQSGGSISDIKLSGTFGNVELFAGSGANTRAAQVLGTDLSEGGGGLGGSVSSIEISSAANLTIMGGSGGASHNNQNGGDGGSILNVIAGITVDYVLSPGLGGTASGGGMAGLTGRESEVSIKLI